MVRTGLCESACAFHETVRHRTRIFTHDRTVWATKHRQRSTDSDWRSRSGGHSDVVLTASAERPTNVVFDACFDDHLPVTPLKALVDSFDGASCFGDPNEPSVAAVIRAYHRGVAKGSLTVWAADMISVRGLGLSPVEVWGIDWELSYQRRERTWPEAIVEVLEQTATPMSAPDIAAAVERLGLRTRLGATPAASVRAAATMMVKSGKWEIERADGDLWVFSPTEVFELSATG